MSIKSATVLPLKSFGCKLPKITSKSDPGGDDDNTLPNYMHLPNNMITIEKN